MWKTLPVWWFLFLLLLQTLSICNKAEQRKNIYPPYQEGLHVSHHILHVHSALSPSQWLFWFDGCNLIRSASIHGWFMSPSLCSGAEKHMEAVSRLFFSPRLFKSTLQHAPLWPLMHPVHLAEQRCETQDHRHGQKQFHPQWANFHWAVWGETGIWYVLLYLFSI